MEPATNSTSTDHLESQYEQALGRQLSPAYRYKHPNGSTLQLLEVSSELADLSGSLIRGAHKAWSRDIGREHGKALVPEVGGAVQVRLCLTVWSCLFAQRLLNAAPHPEWYELNAEARRGLIESLRQCFFCHHRVVAILPRALQESLEEIVRAPDRRAVLEQALVPFLDVPDAPGGSLDRLKQALEELEADELYNVALITAEVVDEVERFDLSQSEIPF